MDLCRSMCEKYKESDQQKTEEKQEKKIKIRDEEASLGAGNTVKVGFTVHQKHRINKAIA